MAQGARPTVESLENTVKMLAQPHGPPGGGGSPPHVTNPALVGSECKQQQAVTWGHC